MELFFCLLFFYIEGKKYWVSQCSSILSNNELLKVFIVKSNHCSYSQKTQSDNITHLLAFCLSLPGEKFALLSYVKVLTVASKEIFRKFTAHDSGDSRTSFPDNRIMFSMNFDIVARFYNHIPHPTSFW